MTGNNRSYTFAQGFVSHEEPNGGGTDSLDREPVVQLEFDGEHPETFRFDGCDCVVPEGWIEVLPAGGQLELEDAALCMHDSVPGFCIHGMRVYVRATDGRTYSYPLPRTVTVNGREIRIGSGDRVLGKVAFVPFSVLPMTRMEPWDGPDSPAANCVPFTWNNGDNGGCVLECETLLLDADTGADTCEDDDDNGNGGGNGNKNHASAHNPCNCSCPDSTCDACMANGCGLPPDMRPQQRK